MNDNKLLDEYVDKVQIKVNEDYNTIILPIHKELNWYYIDFKIMEEINFFLRMTNHSILEPFTSSRDLNDIVQTVIKDNPSKYTNEDIQVIIDKISYTLECIHLKAVEQHKEVKRTELKRKINEMEKEIDKAYDELTKINNKF